MKTKTLRQSRADKAVRNLVQKHGCDQIRLRELVAFLAMPERVEIKPTDGRKPYAINTHIPESWDRLLEGLNPPTLEKLRTMAHEANAIRGEVLLLAKTPMARWVDDFDSREMLHAATRLHQELSRLVELAPRYGPRAQRGTTRRMEMLCRYVFEVTGKWHDSQVATILDANLELGMTALNLKQWRRRHGLSDSLKMATPTSRK